MITTTKKELKKAFQSEANLEDYLLTLVQRQLEYERRMENVSICNARGGSQTRSKKS